MECYSTTDCESCINYSLLMCRHFFAPTFISFWAGNEKPSFYRKIIIRSLLWIKVL